MIRKIMVTGFAVVAASLFLAGSSAQAKLFESSGYAATAGESRTSARRFGPYATLRRANEVANYARRRGYNAKVIYSYVGSSRAYYVDVW